MLLHHTTKLQYGFMRNQIMFCININGLSFVSPAQYSHNTHTPPSWGSLFVNKCIMLFI